MAVEATPVQPTATIAARRANKLKACNAFNWCLLRLEG